MKFLKTLAITLLAGATLTGCEDVLKDNVNPDKAHTNEIEQGMPVLVFYANQTVYDHAEYNIYLSQCLTTMGKSQTGSYGYKSGWEFLTMNRHPQWRRHFYDIGRNANILIENAHEVNSPNCELIARTIRLMSMQLTTDVFGDMPRTEAYLSNAPHYDTQESIYKWMFEEADELNKLYNDPDWTNNPQAHAITKRMDRIYAGDLKMWEGLVYAIRARLLLRNIPNIDRSSKVCQEIISNAQKAIDIWRSGDNLYGAWFGSEPRYNFDGGTGEQNAPWSVAQPKINSWESRDNLLTTAVPSKYMVQDLMGIIRPGDEMNQGYWDRNNGYGNDPRLMLLFQPQDGPISASNDNKRVMIRFLENNIGAGSTYKQAHYPVLYAGAYAGGVDAYTCLFTMEELYFIQAEAYYWMGDKQMACQLSREATEANIQRHLDRYLMDNNGLYPGSNCKPSVAEAAQRNDKARFENIVFAFLNNQPGYNAEVKGGGTAKACSEVGNERWFFDPQNFSLSDLMEQKYIAMYMQPEQWTDMRRYHYSNNRNNYGIGDAGEIVYPTLRRPYNLYAAYWVDGLTEAEKENCWIQRINYDPETEEKYNRPELIRLGAFRNFEWLRKPMIWAEEYGSRTSLTEERAQ
ncbi:MAG: SusD/RagB family nutrient-binding outer membrane lipoprotein [Muribaculaceae bacterium]|nr:SusD/RagB family nutrient-binding outer membrane lipoprotein [Muribaculaceae bacterium]